MTEHELEQRVRAWYRDEIGRDEPAPTSLRSALLQIASVPENPLSIRRNLVLLAAAAMLALALGSAIAIGSGLVRPPWSGNRPLVPIAGRCEPTLSDGVVMTLAGVPAGGLEPEQWMVLYDDGRLVQGPHARADMADMGGIWTVRQVSPEGLTLVQDLLERVDLPSCQSYAITGRDGHQDLMARTAGGVSAFGLGMEAFETRMTSHSEEATASVLADRLNNLDAWIPSSGWTDSTATPYLPDRWSVTVWFPDKQVVGPFAEAWDARLPGGSTLRTFGTELPATEGLLIARCGVVGADDALTIWTALHDESSVVPGELDPFQLQVTLVDGGTVNFRALLLGRRGASRRSRTTTNPCPHPWTSRRATTCPRLWPAVPTTKVSMATGGPASTTAGLRLLEVDGSGHEVTAPRARTGHDSRPCNSGTTGSPPNRLEAKRSS